MSTRLLLVGLARSSRERWTMSESLDELAALTRTSGGVVVERLIQVRRTPDAALLVGRGMAERLRGLCAEHSIALVVFDGSLTPTQQRNLEGVVDRRVVDRAAVILDIFAIHARTAEAKAQVELAQLEYRRTRLTGRGVEMSRLGGGIGTRGPGETQLEVDRRRILQRIAALRHELDRIDRERQVQRRRRLGVFRTALAGYTNAGKSTLFNRLTSARVAVSDRLFATLDASTRMLNMGRYGRVVLTDTVGFIRNLPAQLVASFRSTLSEMRDADLILHVADAGAEDLERRIGVVTDTLEQIGAGRKPVQLVLNKTDRVLDDAVAARLRNRYPDCVLVSALTGDGIERLVARIRERVEQGYVTRVLRIPVARWDLFARVRSAGQVVADTEVGEWRRVRVRGDAVALERVVRQTRGAVRID